MASKESADIVLKIDIGTPLANSRWEIFALALAAGATRTDAYRSAGFKDTAYAGTMAARLYTNELIKRRVEIIRDAVADGKIMNMRDRKIRLSEIAGATLKDFHNEHGVLDPFADGVENQAALAQVEQEYDPDGREAYPVKVKLHNPIPAIDMLNKLEGAYPPSRMEVTGRDGGPIKTQDTRVKLLGLLARISVRLEAKKQIEE